MKTFTKEDGFTVEDMLHFGYGHVDAAFALFKDDAAFFDSAAYLGHLGTEVVLKAWHLHAFGQFKNIHKLATLYDELKSHDNKIDLGTKNETLLKELDGFYSLRYPRKKGGPIEVGSDMVKQFEELLDSLWQLFPNEMIEIYNRLNHTKKGGRVLMETASVSTDLYSQQEKQVSLSILKGESLRSCARRSGISEHKCRSIVNNYCSRSDHDLYHRFSQKVKST